MCGDGGVLHYSCYSWDAGEAWHLVGVQLDLGVYYFIHAAVGQDVYAGGGVASWAHEHVDARKVCA